MCDKAIGIELISKITLPQEERWDIVNEIVIDIEDYITNYMKEKYNATVGGSAKLIYAK